MEEVTHQASAENSKRNLGEGVIGVLDSEP